MTEQQSTPPLQPQRIKIRKLPSLSIISAEIDRLLHRVEPDEYVPLELAQDVIGHELNLGEPLTNLDRLLGYMRGPPFFSVVTVKGVRMIVRGSNREAEATRLRLARVEMRDEDLALLAAPPHRRPRLAGWARLSSFASGTPLASEHRSRSAVGLAALGAPTSSSASFQQPAPTSTDARAPDPVTPPRQAAPAGCVAEEEKEREQRSREQGLNLMMCSVRQLDLDLRRASAVSGDAVLTELLSRLLPGGDILACMEAEERLVNFHKARLVWLRLITLRLVEFYLLWSRSSTMLPELQEAIGKQLQTVVALSRHISSVKQKTGSAVTALVADVERRTGMQFPFAI